MAKLRKLTDRDRARLKRAERVWRKVVERDRRRHYRDAA